MTSTKTGFARYTRLIVVLVIFAVLATAVMLLPKGFSDNVSIIGQGTVVVVLTHNKNSVGSLELMELLNNVRSDYTGKIEFLAVDINTREGQTFVQRQGIGTGRAVLVLFGPDGARKGVLSGRISEKELRSELDGNLSH